MTAGNIARGNVSAFGDLVRDHREKQGLTQEQLAEALGFGQSMVSQIEAGTKVPKARYLGPLADLLGISVAWLSQAIADDVKATPMPRADRPKKRKRKPNRGGH
jgi:transcriptional regulator with XRE-family HTH domain